MTDEANPRSPRRRIARGPERPTYSANADLDRLTIVVLALLSEVSALRDRLDTHERLGTAGTLPALAAVEDYAMDEAVAGERRDLRRAMISRVLRILIEDPALNALAGLDPADALREAAEV